MRRLFLFLPLLLVGCSSSTPATSSTGETADGSTKETSQKNNAGPTKIAPKATNRPDVPADAFGSVPDAIAALTIATEAQANEDRYRATEWLVNQGDAAVKPLASELEDERTGTRSRIVIARIIGRIGTVDAARELAKMANGENQLGAINAIKSLGQIKPSSSGIVNALIKLLDHEDDARSLEAVKALMAIGSDAEVAGDKLIVMQNRHENATIRQAARKALEKVNPRKTLVD